MAKLTFTGLGPVALMIRNDEIPDKSTKNNPSPFENNVLDIPIDIVLDIVDIVCNLDIAR